MRTMVWWAAAVLVLAAGAARAQVEQYPGAPGLTLYSNSGSTLIGVGGPLGIVVGGRVSESLTLDAGADIPVLLSFTNPFGLIFGPLFGVGAEYMVDRNLMVTARVRIGPE